MGIYDMLPQGSQVKLWGCSMTTKGVGDVVMDLGIPKYVVLLREGGYVMVENCIITEIREDSKLDYYPEDFPDVVCLDKWGTVTKHYKELKGAIEMFPNMKDPYYFKSEG